MQKYIDKNGLLKNIKQRKYLAIELGCGVKRKDDFLGIDRLDLEGVDIVSDLEEGLGFLPDDSVDLIKCKSFFEHIENFDMLILEIHRVLKKSGSLELFVPHFSNPYFYSDPTHKRYFGYYTFFYYANKNSIKNLYRKVPEFYGIKKFEICSIKLTFGFYFPVIKHLFNLLEKIVNKKMIYQELYEVLFSSVIPCYGIKVVMKPVKSDLL
ncbi:MAG: methyltransferase domain-containing protein [Candidatus Shapirobacteria bacterium]|jgi:ubiquinone/menaquinone biosynthesis C-methylase UbiE